MVWCTAQCKNAAVLYKNHCGRDMQFQTSSFEEEGGGIGGGGGGGGGEVTLLVREKLCRVM